MSLFSISYKKVSKWTVFHWLFLKKKKKKKLTFLILQNGQLILDDLVGLKTGIVDYYEKWRLTHPDGVDMDTTPNVHTQELWIRDEETANVQILVPGLESQNTVVPMDRTGHHYYRSRRKCRAVETWEGTLDDLLFRSHQMKPSENLDLPPVSMG